MAAPPHSVVNVPIAGQNCLIKKVWKIVQKQNAKPHIFLYNSCVLCTSLSHPCIDTAGVNQCNESWKQRFTSLTSETEDQALIYSDICVLSWSGKWIVALVASVRRASLQCTVGQWNRKLVFTTTTLLISCSRSNRQQWNRHCSNRQQWNRQQWHRQQWNRQQWNREQWNRQHWNRQHWNR